MWENMGNVVLYFIDIFSIMYNILLDLFINDVINGDVESCVKWGSYVLI